MVRKVIFIIILFYFSLSVGQDLNIPEIESTGWQKKESTLIYSAKNLYGRINGGAELFFEFGFQNLKVQEYENNKDVLIFEVYQMIDEVAAIGVYLHKTFNETPIQNIHCQNSGNKYQVLATKGSFFIQVTNPSGNNEYLSIMADLINRLTEYISDVRVTNIFNTLPEKDRIKRSEGIFRGPLALQSIYTFGSGNIFQLSAKDFGIFADYKSGDLSVFTLIHINYAASADAEKAFLSFVNNLDPYLKILSNKNQVLIFKDYNDRYGVVKLKQKLIQIKINLEKLPYH
jgi:hypothetical protein